MVRRAVAEFDAIDGPFLNKLRRIDRSINTFEKNATLRFTGVERGVDSIVASAGRLRTISGIIAGGLGLNIATNFIDQAAQIRNAMREAGDASEETFDKVFRASVRSLSSLTDFTRGVQRIQKAVAGTQDIEASIRQVETLNKLFAISGRTAQERSSTLIQFSQALQASQLGGEELRAIRENAPIELTRAIAREAGGTINDLKALAKQGVLTSEVMIRALDSLAEEADQRFGLVQISISDAAKVFQSGAILVAESLDKGLGASKAAVAILKTLGEFLGENAEEAEIFGKAIKISGIALITAYSGRRLANISQAFRDMASARTADLAAAVKQDGQARRREANAQRAVVLANQRLATMRAEGIAGLALGKQLNVAERAENRYFLAQERRVAATNRALVAQSRMIRSTRALAAAGTVLRGAFNFLGGWVGILLTAAAVLTTMKTNSESLADQFERLTNDTGRLEGASDSARSVMERLSDALDRRGESSQEASSKIIAATIAEFEAKKDLLELENEAAVAVQSEREKRIAALQAERALITQNQARALADIEALRSANSSLPTTDTIVSGLIANLDEEFAPKIKVIDDQIKRLSATVALAAQDIAASDVIIGTVFDPEGPIEYAQQVDEAAVKVDKFISQNISATEKQKAIVEEMTAARAVLVEKYGEEADIVQRLDGAMAQFQAELSNTKSETDGLTNSAIKLRNALASIGTVQLGLEEQISVARAKLRAAEAGANEVTTNAIGAAQAQSQKLLKAGASPDQVAAAFIKTKELNEELGTTEDRLDAILNPSSGGGSGGGGGSSSSGSTLVSQFDEIEREALQFVESMQTGEERLAAQTANLIGIRSKLVAQYGEEAVVVQQLDEAMRRFQETSEASFDNLIDKAAQLATEVNGIKDFVGELIIEMIRLNGVNAFKSLFSGGGLGGFFDELTGGIFDGLFGGSSQQAADLSGVGASSLSPSLLGTNVQQQQTVNITPPAGFDVVERQSTSTQRVDIAFEKQVADAIGSARGSSAISQAFGLRPVAKG